MKKYIPILIFMLSFNIGMAQQTAVFSNYNYNKTMINPAFTGFYPQAELFLGTTAFTNNIEGSPTAQYLTAHHSFWRHQLGLGFQINRDEIGVLQTTKYQANVAYKIPIEKGSNARYWWDYNPKVLSFGISAGVVNWQENLLALNLNNDIKFSQNIQETVPVFNAGVLYNDTHFYVRISFLNLGGKITGTATNFNLETSFLTQLGYRFFLSPYFDKWLVTPNVLVKIVDGAPVQLDANILFNYENKLELGVGYRSTSMHNAFVGTYLKNNMQIMYHYTTAAKGSSPLGAHHGVMLRIQFGEGFGFKRPG
jgi:type IX secretion system PorP/SprF family membrane protein